MAEQYFFAGGKVDLTPTRALPLAGYGGRSGIGTVGPGRLEANILALADDSGHRIVFAGLDLLYAGQVETELRAVMPDVAASEVFLAASHTHSAPATEPLLPALGTADEAYVEFVTTRVRRLIEESLHRVSRREQTCRLTVSVVPHRSAIHRRRLARVPIGDRVRMLPNESGPRDDLIRVLVARSERDNRPLGLVWNHACHPVGYPQSDEISPDFPGVVRDCVRAGWSADIPIVFLQGFAGDLRPPARTPLVPKSVLEIPRRILIGRGFGRFSRSEWHEWSGDLAAAVASCDEYRPRKVDGPIFAARDVVPLSELLLGVPNDLVFSVHVVRFGSAVAIVGISAEVVVEFLPEVIRRVHSDVLIPVGYIDRTVSYLPTRALRAEGGYEAGGFSHRFGTSWRFCGEPEVIVLRMLDRLSVL
jgi:neutral ceramidase